ncbi:MAG: DNA repair protein RadC [Bacteroidaceae bacterium]|nr:DNA repair protein RadC [Bacteroidaceae bacterium]
MVKQKLTITELALEDRPREKMLLQGIRALSTAELIAILIGSGNRNETAVELSQRILNSAGNNLNQLGKYSVADLTSSFQGIGEAKAISIIAALELGRRRKEDDLPERPRIACSNDIYRIFYPLLVDLPYEEFWILLLNAQNRVINKIRVSQGGVSATYVDIRLILKPAIEHLASGIVLCHNHPSGNINPSGEDNRLTERLHHSAELIGIKVLDHIVVCEHTYYSYADEGKL